MNLLELQVRIVISGVPESALGPTLLDWTLPAGKLMSVEPLPFTAPAAIQPPVHRTETQS